MDKVGEAGPEWGGADRRAAAIAERQWGVVTARQLADCGMSRTMISRRVAAGRLRRLYRGVYAFGHDRLRSEGLLLPAAERPRARGRDRRGERRPSTPQRHRSPHRAPARPARCHHTRRHPDHTVARTLVDIAATRSPRQAERALGRAYVQRLLAPGSLEDALERANGKPTRVLKRFLATERKPTITRNDLEEAFLAIARTAGLPDPEVNVPLHGYEADFLFRDKRLVIEPDGFGPHRTKRAFERDRERDVDLELSGYNVRRFTHDQVVYEPERTADRLRRLYEAQ